MHVSTLDCSLQEGIQEAETKGGEEGVKDIKAPDLVLKIGGQFISYKREIDDIFNKELSTFSSTYAIFNEFLQHYKLQVIFTKGPNIGNLILKTKL